MKYFAKFIKTLLAIYLVVGISGCGYKPSAKYVRNVLGSKISTSVVISALNPENTVLVKDAIDSAVLEVFHASITDKTKSDTHLVLSISEPEYSPIQYNNTGFVIAYRATIVLNIILNSTNTKKSYTTQGTYDFSVVPNAVLTDTERFDAIRYSSSKAILAFISKVSAEGSRKK